MGISKKELTSKEKHIIKEASGLGLPQVDIAMLIGATPGALRKWIGEDPEINKLVQEGKAIAHRKVARRLMEIIEGDGKEAITAIFFYLKCQAGWREADKQTQASPPEVNIYLPQKESVNDNQTL